MWFVLCALFTCFVVVWSAPSGQTVYDQKQTGDYNIQVHLKDFQIIALLGDDALGDYDYNYDYSDFTVKPPGGGNVTLKPPPPPEEDSTSSTSGASSSSTTEISSTAAPSSEGTTTKQETEKVTPSTEKGDSLPFSTSSPDRIKVQIIEEPSSNIAIVPADDMGAINVPSLAEVFHIRKCANGYTRDKKGRCRRVRRPGHPQLDISRLASNLASRFRLSEEDPSSTPIE